MRISFILPGCANSGGVRVTVVQANHLLKRGHSIRILYKRTSPSLRAFYRYARRRFISGVPRWVDIFKGRLESFKDITECAFQNGDLIVGVGMWSAAQLGRLDNLPNAKVQFLHEASPWDPDLVKMAISLPLPKILVASHLVPLVQSQGQGEILGVVNNGIDTSEYFCSRDESERDGVGMIFSLHPAKDPETLIKVADAISKARPHVPVRIFSSGRKPRQLPRKFFWRWPSLEKARDIYSRSLVWIMASRSEGFPAPVLEAMSCGCAVVATDCGGPRDMIEDGRNGFLVEVGNVRQIVDRVFKLLDDEQLRTRIRRKGLETVRRFTWERSIDQLEQLLRRAHRGSLSRSS